MKKVFLESRSLEEALSLLFDRLDVCGIGRMPEERVQTSMACGRITAVPVFARYSSPAYHSSAMDGFAVRFADTLPATENSPLSLKLGEQAIPVDTGDPLPDGFNAVIMLEDTNRSEDFIEIYAPVAPYLNVRIAGEDIVKTELIVPENHCIRPVDIGAMIAGGHIEIAVRKKPVVTIIPTGSELVDPASISDREPLPPEIVEYNSAMLAGLAEERGAAAVRHRIVPDDFDAIKQAVLEATDKSDIVIINAGSGRGSEDYTSAVIADLGELVFNGVAIKPGKPVVAGIVRNRPVIGIPGYPVSAFLTFRLFVLSLIGRLLGIAPDRAETITATLSRQLSSPMGVDEFVRVNVGLVGDKYIATPTSRGAGLLMSVVRADGMLRIPSGSDGFAAGNRVDVEIFRNRDEIRNTVVCIGSHDNALDLLANSLKKGFPGLSLSSAHVGSMGGIMAIVKGNAHMAGVHLLDTNTGEYNVPFIKQYLSGRRVALINFTWRMQGLLVKKGNPKKITGLDDLVRTDVVFINRQAGSGTRLLLDKSLTDRGIDPAAIKGYGREEYTHMAVASSVLTGLADAGLAVLPAAKALGLDFIPIAEERYDLIIPVEHAATEKMSALLEIIRHDTGFRESIMALGGYDIRDTGKVVFEN